MTHQELGGLLLILVGLIIFCGGVWLPRCRDEFDFYRAWRRHCYHTSGPAHVSKPPACRSDISATRTRQRCCRCRRRRWKPFWWYTLGWK